jgi:ABC-type multidrug transport system ATPase subunit
VYVLIDTECAASVLRCFGFARQLIPILQDVLSLRKRSGVVSGSVFLNGWPQEINSFRRCSGYVEQFDVQSPELTVFETIRFSARLRLDQELLSSSFEVDEYVKQIMVRETVQLRRREEGSNTD